MNTTAAAKGAVLVVDDNETVLYSKTHILERAGFEVLRASTGADALRMVAEHRPRLVVLDVQLPDIDGWEVCRRIKAAPETASVLVLQTSATFVSDSDTVRSLEGGADGCLTEPTEPPVLIATIRALLRARAAEDALRVALDSECAARAEAESANRTKDEFLATLSHELRAPLGAMLNWVTLLRTAEVDVATRARGLEAIERNTRLQTKLIEDLLDVSRIISGKMRLELRPVDLAAVVTAARESVQAAADAKGVVLSADVDPDMGFVSGDAARLQQVVWNLLGNAVKFTPKGGKVHVALDCRESYAELRVTDTGKGIAPAFLPRVFERFSQGDASTTRAEGGLGLGLSIVRHLVELHGGTVEAFSEGSGTGSTFTIRLPVPAVRLSADAAGDLERQDRTSLRLANLRVLVVDDEVDARDTVAMVLERDGASVVTAGSVAAAMTAFEEQAFDVVISDIAMPYEDGYALIRRLREAVARGGHPTATLALTAFGGTAARKAVLEAGFQAYLTKPVDPAQLSMTIARIARPARV